MPYVWLRSSKLKSIQYFYLLQVERRTASSKERSRTVSHHVTIIYVSSCTLSLNIRALWQSTLFMKYTVQMYNVHVTCVKLLLNRIC